MNKINQKNRGFTLIELLVVIAIIAAITAVILVAFNKVKMQQRDAQRKIDITNIGIAIEKYITANGFPPKVAGAMDARDFDGTWSILEQELKPYIYPLPKDPCGLDCYKASGGQKWFAYEYSANPLYNKTQSGFYVGAENLESNGDPFRIGTSTQ
jgi:prepilin-type N-terminal cleavage/methylation domain-containing protein